MTGKTLKYIRTRAGFTVFPAATGMHSDIARSLNFPPVSAGFIDWIDGRPVCHGRSESLNLDARADDTAVLQTECGMEAPAAPADWNQKVEKLCEDWGMEYDTVTAIFSELLPHWHRDPSQTHIWLSINALTRRDDYGVYGSDFYSCRLCDAESGAGLLNKGIPHEHGCPLHDDNFGKLIAAPVTLTPAMRADAASFSAATRLDGGSLEQPDPVL